jgi:SAM-dependent methyltransferase
MNDSDFEDRTKAIEWMVSFFGPAPEVLGGKSVVEIGSGFGCGAIACIRNGAAAYLGIEPEPFGSRLIEIEGKDPNYRLAFQRAAKGLDTSKIRFFEGFADEWPGAGFDICLLADMMEHVGDPSTIASDAARLLRPGGYALSSTAPLYYSPSGHHLFDVFPDTPWAHLYANFDAAAALRRTSEYLFGEYQTLNRTTHPKLLQAFVDAGFEIVKHRTIYDEGLAISEYEHLIAREHLESVSRDVFEQTVSQILARKLPARIATK